MRRTDTGEIIIFIKINTVTARVIENAVQNDVHAARLDLFDKSAERLLAAEHLVDLAVIGGIILVVGGRFKDRVEIKAGHTEGCQIIQLFGNTLQVSSEEEIVFIVFFSVTQKFGEFFQVSTKHRIFFHRVISRRKESIGENLIKDTAEDPFRGSCSLLINEKLKITSAIARRSEGFGKVIALADHIESTKVRKNAILIEKETSLCATAKLCHGNDGEKILSVAHHFKSVEFSRIVTKDLHLCAHGGFGHVNTEFHLTAMLEGSAMGDVFSVYQFLFQMSGHDIKSRKTCHVFTPLHVSDPKYFPHIHGCCGQMQSDLPPQY